MKKWLSFDVTSIEDDVRFEGVAERLQQLVNSSKVRLLERNAGVKVVVSGDSDDALPLTSALSDLRAEYPNMVMGIARSVTTDPEDLNNFELFRVYFQLNEELRPAFKRKHRANCKLCGHQFDISLPEEPLDLRRLPGSQSDIVQLSSNMTLLRRELYEDVVAPHPAGSLIPIVKITITGAPAPDWLGLVARQVFSYEAGDTQYSAPCTTCGFRRIVRPRNYTSVFLRDEWNHSPWCRGALTGVSTIIAADLLRRFLERTPKQILSWKPIQLV